VVGSVPSWKEMLLLQAPGRSTNNNSLCEQKTQKNKTYILMTREAPPASKQSSTRMMIFFFCLFGMYPFPYLIIKANILMMGFPSISFGFFRC
jgi:hypothetical protein